MANTNFPRYRNSHCDTGEQLETSIGVKCPNCGSPRYKTTISTEDCPDCGLHCDYWGSGANPVYEAMMERTAAVEKARLEEEDRRENDRSW